MGGVLGTPGWGYAQRVALGQQFGLDPVGLESRHAQVIDRFECGRMSLDEYLDAVVFPVPQGFTRDAFRQSMLEQSAPFPETVSVARALSRNPRYRLMTINNESAELNAHRLQLFGLTDVFVAFFSSCWLGVRKPDPRIYELALAISQAAADRSVFIDDRAENLGPAQALGMDTIVFTNVDELMTSLQERGIAV